MRSHLRLPALLLLLSAAACAGQHAAPMALPPPTVAPGGTLSSDAASSAQERLLIRQAALELVAREPAALAPRVTEIARGAGGYVESSLLSEGRVLRASLRVPSPALEPTLASLSALGEVERRQVSAVDVTEQIVDLEARLRNLRAVRDRLRQYLDRTTAVGDIIQVERELTRVQSEIEVLEGRLNRLRTDTSLSQIGLEIRRKRVLGPLGHLVAGAAWVVSKLFVIR